MPLPYNISNSHTMTSTHTNLHLIFNIQYILLQLQYPQPSIELKYLLIPKAKKSEKIFVPNQYPSSSNTSS